MDPMMNDGDYLMHYGVLGMKWGVRKVKDSSDSSKNSKEKKEPSQRKITKGRAKEYRTDKGPTRYKFLNAANSAARSHYRSETTSSFKTYRNELRKRDRKEARLTTDQIKNGRYRVARARAIKRNIASVAISVAAGSVLAASGAAELGLAFAVLHTPVAHFTTGAHYYGQERKAYGTTRAKYQTKDEQKKKQKAQGVKNEYYVRK